MARTRGSYPHPVLDSSDDVDSSIEIFNFTFAPSIDDVEIRFQVRMTDPDIQHLLDAGAARYNFRWSCSSTISIGDIQAFPAQIYADSTAYSGGIDQEDIRGTVRLEFKVIATKDIDQYRLQRQHADYRNAHFSLMPGDVIADGGYIEFEPEKLYDAMNPPIGSCFRFVTDPKRKKGLSIRFDDNDHVNVLFPEKVLQGFGLLKDNPELQISLVVLPALIETICFLKDNLSEGSEGEDLSERKWYKPIKDLVDGVGSFEDPVFETAQKILGHCLDESLTIQLNETESEDA